MDDSRLSLLNDAKNYVSAIFQNKVSKSITYHNLEHTEDVVAASKKMAEYYQLDEEDKDYLLIAAWFHDTGYSTGTAAGHEEESIKTAVQFLTGKDESPEFIEKVRHAILATKMPQSPANPVEEILCDADLHHLGTADFKQKNKALRKELANISGADFSKKKWKKKNIQFLESHQYFTSYGRENRIPAKPRLVRSVKA